MPEMLDRFEIANAPLSVILPARHGPDQTAEALSSWLKVLSDLQREHQLIVVDDGSSDRTGECIAELAATSPSVLPLRHEVPRGIGAALRTGLAAARHPLVCYCDCTTAYNASDLALLLADVDEVDVVNACRAPIGGKARQSPLEFIFDRLVRMVFGLHLRDVNSSFKLFRRSLFTRIPIQSDTSFAHAEILAKANFLGCLLAEAEVSYRPEHDSQPWRTSLRQRRADAMRVFRRPDFGPAILPPESAGPTEVDIPLTRLNEEG